MAEETGGPKHSGAKKVTANSITGLKLDSNLEV